MYQCEYFQIEELVPPEAMQRVQDPAILWWLFDGRGLYVLDMLRKDYGPITVNDWIWGGEFTDSGLRLPGSEYYSLTSQHSHGRAFDAKTGDVPVQDIRKDIINRKKDYMRLITGLELDVSWLHIDFRNSCGKLHTFKP